MLGRLTARLNDMTHRNAVAIGLAVMLCAIGLTGWIMFHVPPNMDEFLPFHPIACSVYTNASPYVLLDGCGQHAAETVWHYNYFRPFAYVGMLSSAIYYPVFMAWPSIHSNYVLGLAFTLAFYLGFMRLHRLDKSWLLPLLCFFPISFQIIHDMGPVRFSLLSFVLVPLLAHRMEKGRQLERWLSALLIPVCMALAIEDKPFFVLLVPGLVCYALAFCERPGALIAGNWGRLIVSAGLLAGFVCLIAFQRAGPAGDRFYYQDLMGTGIDYDYMHVLRCTVAYLAAPARYAHRIFDIPLPTLLIAALAGLAFFWLPLARNFSLAQQRTTWLCLSVFLIFAAFLYNKAVWAGHHFIFMMPPLLSLFVQPGKAFNASSLKLCLAAGGMSCAVILTFANYAADSAKDRDAVFRYLSQTSVAEQNIINISDWGMFYIQSLYGAAPQQVTNVKMGNEAPLDELITLARQRHRNILNVCMSCDPQSVSRDFPGQHVEEIALDAQPWRVFKVSLSAPDGSPVASSERLKP